MGHINKPTPLTIMAQAVMLPAPPAAKTVLGLAYPAHPRFVAVTVFDAVAVICMTAIFEPSVTYTYAEELKFTPVPPVTGIETELLTAGKVNPP